MEVLLKGLKLKNVKLVQNILASIKILLKGDETFNVQGTAASAYVRMSQCHGDSYI